MAAAEHLPPWDGTHPEGACPFRDYVSSEIEIRRGKHGVIDTVVLHWTKRGLHITIPFAQIRDLPQPKLRAMLEAAGRKLHHMKKGASDEKADD